MNLFGNRREVNSIESGFLEGDIIYVPYGLTIYLSVELDCEDLQLNELGKKYVEKLNEEKDYDNGWMSQKTYTTMYSIQRVVSVPLFIKLIHIEKTTPLTSTSTKTQVSWKTPPKFQSLNSFTPSYTLPPVRPDNTKMKSQHMNNTAFLLDTTSNHLSRTKTNPLLVQETIQKTFVDHPKNNAKHISPPPPPLVIPTIYPGPPNTSLSTTTYTALNTRTTAPIKKMIKPMNPVVNKEIKNIQNETETGFDFDIHVQSKNEPVRQKIEKKESIPVIDVSPESKSVIIMENKRDYIPKPPPTPLNKLCYEAQVAKKLVNITQRFSSSHK